MKYSKSIRRFLPALAVVSLLGTSSFISGCANKLSGDVYSREDARQQMQVRYGTIESVRAVVLEGDRNLLGQGGGAIIGGMAGNSLGGGSTQGIATAVGAVAGAVVGGMTQEKATRAQGAELIVRMESGESISVVQEVESLQQFYNGQRVRLTVGNGNTRVAPIEVQ